MGTGIDCYNMGEFDAKQIDNAIGIKHKRDIGKLAFGYFLKYVDMEQIKSETEEQIKREMDRILGEDFAKNYEMETPDIDYLKESMDEFTMHEFGYVFSTDKRDGFSKTVMYKDDIDRVERIGIFFKPVNGNSSNEYTEFVISGNGKSGKNGCGLIPVSFSNVTTKASDVYTHMGNSLRIGELLEAGNTNLFEEHSERRQILSEFCHDLAKTGEMDLAVLRIPLVNFNINGDSGADCEAVQILKRFGRGSESKYDANFHVSKHVLKINYESTEDFVSAYKRLTKLYPELSESEKFTKMMLGYGSGKHNGKLSTTTNGDNIIGSPAGKRKKQPGPFKKMVERFKRKYGNSQKDLFDYRLTFPEKHRTEKEISPEPPMITESEPANKERRKLKMPFGKYFIKKKHTPKSDAQSYDTEVSETNLSEELLEGGTDIILKEMMDSTQPVPAEEEIPIQLTESPNENMIIEKNYKIDREAGQILKRYGGKPNKKKFTDGFMESNIFSDYLDEYMNSNHIEENEFGNKDYDLILKKYAGEVVAEVLRLYDKDVGEGLAPWKIAKMMKNEWGFIKNTKDVYEIITSAQKAKMNVVPYLHRYDHRLKNYMREEGIEIDPPKKNQKMKKIIDGTGKVIGKSARYVSEKARKHGKEAAVLGTCIGMGLILKGEPVKYAPPVSMEPIMIEAEQIIENIQMPEIAQPAPVMKDYGSMKWNWVQDRNQWKHFAVNVKGNQASVDLLNPSSKIYMAGMKAGKKWVYRRPGEMMEFSGNDRKAQFIVFEETGDHITVRGSSVGSFVDGEFVGR